ncbi:unnamed protein product [Calypogeia fissa]
MEDGLAAEMAALGLPSSFIAGLGHSPSTTTKSRRKKPSSSLSQSRTGTDDKHAESLGATDGNVPSSNFRIQSIRLYTPKDSELDYEIEGCDRLDSSIAAQEERAVIEGDDAANALLCSAGTSEHSMVDVRGGREESCVVDSVDVRWEPVWDEQYQCYYFCNIKTWESTWDSPPGFENYAATTSLAADQQTGSLFGTRERTLGQVCDEGISFEGERDSGSSVCAIPGVVEQSEDEEGRLSAVEKLEAMANYGGEVNGCEDERNDIIVKGSSKEEIQFLLGITNSHIRFEESDDSNSGSPGEGQENGIDWTEISEEMPIQFRKQNDDEEGKDGCEACSGSSQHLVSSFQLKARQRIKASEMGTKKRRVRSLSEGDQLDEVKLPGIVGMMNKDLVKYWIQRYSLFTKFDEGVKMDEEGWFSVTPEIIAKHQASRCVTGLVIDAFTGVGGNAIQFAFQSYRVIAIDINPTRIDYARHNAEIYGVSDKIEFIVGDFFQLAPFLKADLVFLSPPWGGPEYLKQEIYDLHTMLKPKDGITLFKVAQSIAPNIALFVPRNVDLNQLQELSWLTSPPLPCEVEQNYVNDKLKAITAYYGDIAGGDRQIS